MPLLKMVASFGISNQKHNILIDTGASVSILPISLVSNMSLLDSSVRITAANNMPIKVSGEVTTHISFRKLRRSYMWTFIVADVTTPIIGLDFLQHYEFSINCATGEVSDSNTNISAHAEVSKRDGLHSVQINLPGNNSFVQYLRVN